MRRCRVAPITDEDEAQQKIPEKHCRSPVKTSAEPQEPDSSIQVDPVVVSLKGSEKKKRPRWKKPTRTRAPKVPTRVMPHRSLTHRSSGIDMPPGLEDTRHKLWALNMFKRSIALQAPEFEDNSQKDAHEFITSVLEQMRSLAPPL
ncbi:ubiquitin carboxyl-terminal hydrolase 46-like protein [Lates japonicus]|uniref:Ubiquitin carboxyl-terminal hydrolase 46-like protein n=1 Tax=Lates japonicus TaxID=270547 RepID=A0AAD3RCM9_LATJO|nr:ubiquitin carboxyl-terminal hydrolase 46-like protein [Lates japonicus]